LASEGRRNGTDLIDRMKSEPFRFRFFQAIRLLKLSEKATGRKASIPRLFRFRTPLSLAFPTSEIQRFEARMSRGEQENGTPEEEAHQEMEVGFLGLTGPSGVLPHCYTEMLIDRKLTQRDASAHAFLDIFNHRAISLFYEAWQKYRFYVGYEMGERKGFTQHLTQLMGSAHSPAVPPQLMAFFSGALGRRPLPASSLRSIISSYFGVRLQIEQFVGQWIEAPLSEQTALGRACATLGESAVVGQRLWDRQTKIRLRIGPLEQAAFNAFLPGGPAALALHHLVGLCLGQALNCDVALVLKKEAAGDTCLKRAAAVPVRLGVNAWARTSPPTQDLEDVRFRLI